MKKLIAALIAVFLVLALAIGGFTIYAVNTGFSFGWGTPDMVNRQAMPAKGVDVLNIAYRNDSVRLEKTFGDEIILEEYMTKSTDDMLASVYSAGSTLSIEGGSRPMVNIMWISHIVVYIPDSWQGTLVASTSSGSVRTSESWNLTAISLSTNSGSVRAENITATGSVELKTSSGAVGASDITAGGTVHLSSNSGSVRASSITAAAIEMKSGSGSVRAESAVADTISLTTNSGSVGLEYAEGAFTLKSGSGSVRLNGGIGHGTAESSSGTVSVKLSEVTGDVRLTGKSGSVRLEIPRGLNFTFEASTNSGSLKTDFDEELSYNSKGNAATGTVGQNPEVDIVVTGSSGSVRVSYV